MWDNTHPNVPLCSVGTPVPSCDSCHDEAMCLETKDRGDAFLKLSCICKDGFVGDGLTCYDRKLCSDSDCCAQGYQWSAESGCEDIDECSLPDSPCRQPQVCQNTPGSYECLQPSSSTKSGPSARLVLVDCGHGPCPEGTDCLERSDGLMYCIDPCENYSVLDDEWRAINYTANVGNNDAVDFDGWYRFVLWQKSAHIPERCVAERRCGTIYPIWVKTPHPTQSGVIKTSQTCLQKYGRCCFNTNQIYVKLCYGDYYIYKLRQTALHTAYCAGTCSVVLIFNSYFYPYSNQSVFHCAQW